MTWIFKIQFAPKTKEQTQKCLPANTKSTPMFLISVFGLLPMDTQKPKDQNQFPKTPYFGHLVIFQPVGTNLIHASRRCTIQPKLSLMLFGNTVKASCAALTGFITIMFAGYSDVKTSLLHRFGIGLTDSVLEKDRSHDAFRGEQ